MLNNYLEFLRNQSFVYFCEYEGFYGTLHQEVEVYLEEAGIFFKDELEEFLENLDAFVNSVEEIVGGKLYDVDDTTHIYIIDDSEAFEAEYH